MKKLAIIGASYFQEPLIQKAKMMGIETHVFAWACGDIGEKSADHFYPISIVEKETILKKCKEIQIDGICSIASDLAVITVNYVANELGLIGNDAKCTVVSTNKNEMRKCFERNGDPSPKSIKVQSIGDLDGVDISYPIIVKPVDRSGSRGITKLEASDGLLEAIEQAKEQSFEKVALIEEFVAGKEYSVEYISWEGNHTFLAITQKYTTNAPHFIETAHLEPANLDTNTVEKIKKIVEHALSGLGIRYGASHTELKIAEDGEVKLIEIGGRMGGDFIGSALVELSTGVDFLEAVIDIALGNRPQIIPKYAKAGAVRFVFTDEDVKILQKVKQENPEYLLEENIEKITEKEILDSSTRFGYYILRADSSLELFEYLPDR